MSHAIIDAGGEELRPRRSSASCEFGPVVLMAQLAGSAGPLPAQRKAVLLRLDPRVYDALARWAADEFRSTNGQIEFLLREALAAAGRIRAAEGARRRRHAAPP